MPKKIPKKSKTFDFTVVGLQYRVTPSSRRMLVGHLPIPVELEREPENTHDENAIKVVIMHEADIPFEGFHIGYLSRGVASAWASAMDTGKLTIAEAAVTGIDVDAGTATIRVEAQGSAKLLSTKPK